VSSASSRPVAAPGELRVMGEAGWMCCTRQADQEWLKAGKNGTEEAALLAAQLVGRQHAE